MPKKQINLGHPEHGRGGKSGHQTTETYFRNITRSKIEDKIARRQAKAERKQERNMKQLMENLENELLPKINLLYATLRKEMAYKKGSRRTNLLKILAINEWYIDEIERRLIKKKVTRDPLNLAEREQVSLVEKEDYLKYMADLIGNNPTERSVVDLRDQLAKWKNRVPKMMLGHY